MTIELAKVSFINDMFTTILPDGKIIVINTVNESLLPTDETRATPIKCLNIDIRDAFGNIFTCPSAIGLGNELMQINTDHKEYEGEVLTPGNMEFCTIEIYD